MSSASPVAPAAALPRLVYPPVRREEAGEGNTTSLHGKRVVDAYRWLEEPDAPETAAFVAAQNAVTAEYTKVYEPARAALRARLERLQNYERVSAFQLRGGAGFAYHNSGLQNQDVLYRLPAASLIARVGSGVPLDVDFTTATPLLDLNKEFPAGTTSLGSRSFSHDGTYFAYGLQHAGSDWQTVYVRNAVTGEQLPDKIQWTKFSSLAWTHDNAGFFYTRHPAPAVIAGSDAESGAAGTETTATTHSMVLYHRLGTSEAEDVLVYARADEPVWRFGLEVTDDGEYLIITIHKGTDPVNRLYAAHLPSVWSAWLSTRSPLTLSHSALPPAMSEYTYLPLMHVIHNFEGQFEYVCNDGTSFLFKTNYEAPRARVVELILTVDAAAHVSQPPAQDASVPPLRNVIPEHASNVLDWCSVFDTATLMCCYMEDVKNVLTTQVLSTNGACEHVVTNLSTVPLPGPGTIMGAFGQRFCDTAFVKFVSFVHPGTIIKIQTDAAARVAVSEDVYNTRIEGFDPRAYSVEQRFVRSTDGSVRLPLFIVRKAGAGGGAPAAPATPSPTLLYGYGGFNVSLQPSFNAMRLAWLDDVGGVYALACIRGGGEYGEEWHKAGMGLKKQNCFDDMCECANELIKSGVTTATQLGIMGGSNGGLLVLACALQRPHLFRAIVSQVPVADMLRFHLFTVGALWRGEYGFSETSAEDFHNMLKYSPYHNVRPITSPEQQLPAVLITTADHDDRVVPLHSFKMIAELQHVAGPSEHQKRPLLTRIETQAGHGAGKPTSKVLDEIADVYAFLQHELCGGY